MFTIWTRRSQRLILPCISWMFSLLASSCESPLLRPTAAIGTERRESLARAARRRDAHAHHAALLDVGSAPQHRSDASGGSDALGAGDTAEASR
jgi:hypothetical protein